MSRYSPTRSSSATLLRPGDVHAGLEGLGAVPVEGGRFDIGDGGLLEAVDRTGVRRAQAAAGSGAGVGAAVPLEVLDGLERRQREHAVGEGAGQHLGGAVGGVRGFALVDTDRDVVGQSGVPLLNGVHVHRQLFGPGGITVVRAAVVVVAARGEHGDRPSRHHGHGDVRRPRWSPSSSASRRPAPAPAPRTGRLDRGRRGLRELSRRERLRGLLGAVAAQLRVAGLADGEARAWRRPIVHRRRRHLRGRGPAGCRPPRSQRGHSLRCRASTSSPRTRPGVRRRRAG